jgi:hypothetical protein
MKIKAMKIKAVTMSLLALLISLSPGSAQADDPLPPVTPRVTGATVLEIKSGEAGQKKYLLLSRGSKHGVAPGDKFAILRNEKKVGEVVVFAVLEDLCSTRVSREISPIKKGDVAVRLGQTKGKQILGEITQVSAASDMVQVSLGLSDGVKNNQVLDVYSDGQRIGSVRVIDCKRKSCVARILSDKAAPNRARVAGKVFKVGDRVKKARKSVKESLVDIRSQRIMKQAAELRAKARQLEAQARRLRKQASAFEDKAAKLKNSDSKKAAKTVIVKQLGVEVSAARVFATGVEIVRILPGSIARKAGLKVGEVIYQFNDKVIDNSQMLLGLIDQLARGKAAKVTVLGKDGTRSFVMQVKGD